MGRGVPVARAVACRRPRSETYRRDLDKYVLPRFGAYRLGRLPADEIENWLNDEIAAGMAPSSVHRHYRTLRRVLQVAVEKRSPDQPVRPRRPAEVPKREMTFLDWDQAIAPRRGAQRAIPGADLRRHRHRHALERARRPAARQGRPRRTGRSA